MNRPQVIARCARCCAEVDRAGNCPVCAAMGTLAETARRLGMVGRAAGQRRKGAGVTKPRPRQYEAGQDKALPVGDRE